MVTFILTGVVKGTVDFGGQTLNGIKESHGYVFIAKYNSNGVLQWMRGLRGDNTFVSDIAVDDSGDGVYITGQLNSNHGAVEFNFGGATSVMITSSNGTSLFLAKYDTQDGENRWVKTMVSTNPAGIFVNNIHALAVNESGVFLTGDIKTTFEFNGEGDPVIASTVVSGNNSFLAKYNHNGSCAWVKVFGEGKGFDVIANNTEVYVTGNFAGTVNFGPGGTSAEATVAEGGTFIAKYDAGSGANMWVSTPTHTPSSAYSFKLALSGEDIYAFGDFSGLVDFENESMWSRGNQDLFLVKYNTTAGSFQWVETVTGQNFWQHQSISADGTGVYLAGSFDKTITFGEGDQAVSKSKNGKSDIYVSHFAAADGQITWVKSIGGEDDEKAFAAVATSYGIYIAGDFQGKVNFNPTGSTVKTNKQNTDIFITKYDATLSNLIWAVHCKGGTGGGDNIYSMAKDADGNIYMAGYFQGEATFGNAVIEGKSTDAYGSAKDDAYLAKYNPAGEVQWIKPLVGTDFAYGSKVVAEGDFVYLTGRFSGEVDFNAGGTAPLVKASSSFIEPVGYVGGAYVAKYNRHTGEALWVRTIEQVSRDTDNTVNATSLAVHEGKLYVTGDFNGQVNFGGATFRESQGTSDGFLLKLDEVGEIEWLRIAGGGRTFLGSTTASNQGIFITGGFEGEVDFNMEGSAAKMVANEGSSTNFFIAR